MRKINIRDKNPKDQRKSLISYADNNYKESQHLQTKTAKIAGFTEVIEYEPEDIVRLKEINKKVLLNQWLCAALPRAVGLRLIERRA